MHNHKWALFLVILVLVPIGLLAADEGDFSLRFLQGDVQIKMEDNGEWVPAAANMPVYPGDKLWVPDDGRAEVQFRDGTLVRAGRSSAFEIGQEEQDAYLLYLDQGQLYVNFRASGAPSLVIETPDAAFRAEGACLFHLQAPENGDIAVSVLKGAVYVDRDAGEIRVGAGERLVVRNHGASVDVARLGPEDEWERWNRQRDQNAYNPALAYSSGYLPEELQPYASDLDGNGRWQYTPDYGYVWTPTVVVAGWSPYSMGRWVWIRGDYVWISSERWGWAPYHYGRWAHVNRIGWCWVPPRRGSVYWGPGYVGWVHTPTHVAWVPLAPGETYYGKRYYGPNSVNITQARVQSPVTNMYRNVYVTHAVTTVQRDAFLAGRPAGGRTRENPFLTVRPSPGAPPIAPLRATAMPMVKEIPPAKQPPARIRQAAFARPHEPLFRSGAARTALTPERHPTGAGASQQRGPVSAPPRSPAPSAGAGTTYGAPRPPEHVVGRTPGREEVVRYTTADVATTRADQDHKPAASQGWQGMPQNGRIDGRIDHVQGWPAAQIPRPPSDAQTGPVGQQQIRPRPAAPLTPPSPPRPAVAPPAPVERQTQAGGVRRVEPIMRRPEVQENRRPVAGDQGRMGNAGAVRPPEPGRVIAPPRPAAVIPPVQAVHQPPKPPAHPQQAGPQHTVQGGLQRAPDHRPAPAQAAGGDKHGAQQQQEGRKREPQNKEQDRGHRPGQPG